MFHSIRHNVYLFFCLLVIFCILGILIHISNRAVQEQLTTSAKVVDLNNLLSQAFLHQQKEISNPDSFTGIFDEQTKLLAYCTSCHVQKTDLPARYLTLLPQQNKVLLEIQDVHNKVKKMIKKLAQSVQFIHEHHIAVLSDFLKNIRISEDVEKNKRMWKVYAQEAALEPDLVSQAVSIQQTINAILTDFNTLASTNKLSQVHLTFHNHLKELYDLLKEFETLSTDPYDGILVEELFNSSKILEKEFNFLVKLEEKKRTTSILISQRQQDVSKKFLRVKKILQNKQNMLTLRLDWINRFSLGMGILVGILFLVHARNMLKYVDLLVTETEKISSDISYQIKEKFSAVFEFSLLRNALNSMALSLNRQVIALDEEIEYRQHIESLLNNEKDEWELTFNAVPDVIFIVDIKHRITRANQAMVDLLGIPLSEILGQKCYAIFQQKQINPPLCINCPEGKEQFVNSESKPGCHGAFVELDGRYFSVMVASFTDSYKETAGWVHLMRDISTQRKAELENEKNALYLDSILTSSTHTAIIAIDQDLCVQYFNPESERIFSLKAENILGCSINEAYTKILSGRNVDPSLATMVIEKQQAIRAGETVEFVFEFDSAIIETRISVIRDVQKVFSGFLFMASDITDRVRASEKEQKMAERLQKAEKMEMIGLMAGGVAHDLNNILSGIINYPELMLLKMEDNQKWQKILEAIRDSGLRAAAIVADLLTLARGVASAKEHRSMNTLITAYFASPEYMSLRDRFPGVEVRPLLADNLCTCYCSPVHIQKTIMNLITNAYEAVGAENGYIVITTENVYVDNKMAFHYELPAGKYVKVEIVDNGSGIGDEDRRHLFEPFYTTKKMGSSGTGLGLAVVWNTVQDHGGRITVNSSEKGTTFTILLPAGSDIEDQHHSELGIE